MSKKFLTKDEILAAKDLKVVEVDVPEWQGTVRVSEITAADRLILQAQVLDDNGKPKKASELNRLLTIGLCALAIVDEHGEKLFTVDDIEAFGKKCGTAIDRIFAVADDLNGVSATVAGKIKKN